MKVFISWSGELSNQVALSLRDWLQNVIQSLKPYVSSEDVYKGARWHSEISKELQTTDFGIICLTPTNLEKPWLLFESGALSKLEKSKVIPFLISLKPTDVKGPLAEFQATIFNKADVKRMIISINNNMGEDKLENARIEKLFEKWWPELEESLNNAIKESTEAKMPKELRPEREILEEILQLLRSIGQLAAREHFGLLNRISLAEILAPEIQVRPDIQRDPIALVLYERAKADPVLRSLLTTMGYLSREVGKKEESQEPKKNED